MAEIGDNMIDVVHNIDSFLETHISEFEDEFSKWARELGSPDPFNGELTNPNNTPCDSEEEEEEDLHAQKLDGRAFTGWRFAHDDSDEEEPIHPSIHPSVEEEEEDDAYKTEIDEVDEDEEEGEVDDESAENADIGAGAFSHEEEDDDETKMAAKRGKRHLKKWRVDSRNLCQ